MEIQGGLAAGLARIWPEQRIFFRSATRTSYLRLSPLAQCGLTLGLGLALVWMLVATAAFAMTLIQTGSRIDQISLLRELNAERLAAVTEERDAAARAAAVARTRFHSAMEALADRQSELLRLSEARRSLELGLSALRRQLGDAIRTREQALRDNAALSLENRSLTAALTEGSGSTTDLAKTLQTIAFALQDSQTAREAAEARLAALNGRVVTLEGRAALAEARQARVLERLEEAVEVSLGGLSGALSSTGLDVDSLVASLRDAYSGTGGPLLLASATAVSFDSDPVDARVGDLMQQMERLQLLRLASTKLPFAEPVRAAFRFTSGFGTRKDPRGRRLRQHLGIDLAGTPGTPIHTTADGVIIHAGPQHGYGNVVKIRHAFGVETVYAHLRTIRVKLGDRVALGDRIGDMGNTGRSTGTHLHYEIRINGSPVNPMTYLKAAKDVL